MKFINTPLTLFLLIFSSATFQASNRPSFWSNFFCRSTDAVIAPEITNRRLYQSPKDSSLSSSSENSISFDDDSSSMQLFTKKHVQAMNKQNELKILSLRSSYERKLAEEKQHNNRLEDTNSDLQRTVENLNWQLHAAKLVNSECNRRLPKDQKFNGATDYSRSIRSDDVIMSLQSSNYELELKNEELKDEIKTIYDSLANITKKPTIEKNDLIVLESRIKVKT